MTRKERTYASTVRRFRNSDDEHGWVLVSAIVMILFLTAIGFSIAGLAGEQYQHTRLEMFQQNAELVAEAGIEQSVDALNSNDAFTGFGPSMSQPTQTFFSNTTQGKSTFTTTVTTNADGTSKTVVSTGLLYHNVGDTTPYLTRKVRATVVGTGSSGYSVSTGPGGLILSGSAAIANSNVFVNGTVSMSGASKIGTDSNPVNVDVGNIACPTGSSPGPTYPSLCSGTQPISIPNNSTVAIIGTTCATGQTQSSFPSGHTPSQIRAGTAGGSGLEVGCTAPAVSQPTYNRSGIISGVTSSQAGSCGGNSNVTLPANVKLTDSTVSWGASCTVTISGNVYIPGDLSVGGSAQIKVASSAGTTRPIIVVDGAINIGGSAAMIANSSGAGIDFVSFKNFTGDPSATPTGTNLYKSEQQQNVNVSGGVSLPGMIFDAYWSTVTLSGSGNLGAAAGQVVNLSGAGTVVFGTQLSSGSKTWTITSYQPLY